MSTTQIRDWTNLDVDGKVVVSSDGIVSRSSGGSHAERLSATSEMNPLKIQKHQAGHWRSPGQNLDMDQIEIDSQRTLIDSDLGQRADILFVSANKDALVATHIPGSSLDAQSCFRILIDRFRPDPTTRLYGHDGTSRFEAPISNTREFTTEVIDDNIQGSIRYIYLKDFYIYITHPFYGTTCKIEPSLQAFCRDGYSPYYHSNHWSDIDGTMLRQPGTQSLREIITCSTRLMSFLEMAGKRQTDVALHMWADELSDWAKRSKLSLERYGWRVEVSSPETIASESGIPQKMKVVYDEPESGPGEAESNPKTECFLRVPIAMLRHNRGDSMFTDLTFISEAVPELESEGVYSAHALRPRSDSTVSEGDDSRTRPRLTPSSPRKRETWSG